MESNNVSGKKKIRLFKAIAICILVAAAGGLFALWYNFYSSHSQSYKLSEANFNKLLAEILKKEPNDLTSEDFLNQKNIVVFGNNVTNLNPLVKYKNLERVDIYGFEDIDLRPLSKLKKLKWLEINFQLLRNQTKSKWYDKPLSVFRISRPVNMKPGPFNLGQLKKLNNLEELILKRYDSVYNIEALAALKNLEHLTLQPNRNKIQAVIFPVHQGKTTSVNFKTEPLDLSPLQSLSKLNYLNLLGVEAVDFSFIEKLSNLEHIYLGGTNISNEQIEIIQKALPELEIVR